MAPEPMRRNGGFFYHLDSWKFTDLSTLLKLQIQIIGCLIHDDYPMKLLHLLNLLKSLAEKPIYKKWNDTKSSKVLLSSYWDELLWLFKSSDEDVITR